ncbi:hypothetical protein [Novacetimonas hansenii]|uniref:hypothetical protein n=1 Tax=Novacetimonas hansenii TaxID=436 RepID=UPI000B150DDE|nr:hypothetical protein [Novacetimonas hansenii]
MEELIKKINDISCISDNISNFISQRSADNLPMILADLGRLLCKDFSRFSDRDKRNIFSLIEKTIENNEKESDMVATMFLESFINCWIDRGHKYTYKEFIGQKSLIFINKLD